MRASRALRTGREWLEWPEWGAVEWEVVVGVVDRGIMPKAEQAEREEREGLVAEAEAVEVC
jgi:hypothetical protein